MKFKERKMCLMHDMEDEIMKKFLAMLLTLCLLLTLCACSTEPDPYAGTYNGLTATVLGMTLPLSDVYPGETRVELGSGGKGTILLDGRDFKMKWKLEGEEITLTVSGDDSVGTLKDGLLKVDLLNKGCLMTFLLEGVELPTEPASYEDAGYWELVRVDSEDTEFHTTEEQVRQGREDGIVICVELLQDGTGVLNLDEPIEIGWVDGTFTIDGMTLPYKLENGEMSVDLEGVVYVFRRAEKE